MIKNLIYIALGGAFGSVLRYIIQFSIHKHFPNAFPYGTFLVNIIGCFLLGLLVSMFSKENQISQQLELLLIAGFCGGFTTFSTFAFEGNTLINQGRIGYAFLYIGLSVFTGMAVAYLGFRLGKA
jgi:fluoride exporter